MASQRLFRAPSDQSGEFTVKGIRPSDGITLRTSLKAPVAERTRERESPIKWRHVIVQVWTDGSPSVQTIRRLPESDRADQATDEQTQSADAAAAPLFPHRKVAD